MKPQDGFFAYPNATQFVSDAIESAVRKNNSINRHQVKSWRQMEIAGSFIRDEVLSSIENSTVVFADISCLNFNVTYEIGYAIGKKKPIILVKNKAVREASPTIRDVGIFDTLGYVQYQNSDELADIIESNFFKDPLDIERVLNHKTPVYLLESKYKTDFTTVIASRLKRARYQYRTFDPNESPRLSAGEAIDNVGQSLGVLITLQPSTVIESDIHNIRAAFLAGLAHGTGKVTKILQQSPEDPIPLDYRDIVDICSTPQDIQEAISDFASLVAEAFQASDSEGKQESVSFLKSISFGANAAENEIRDLDSYYLETDAYLKVKRGECHLVVGRKGSGKSAIFFRVRDSERNKVSNIVLDLKPEGYKLLKLKELVLKNLQLGAFQHTLTAFWEYVLLMEIAHKIMQSDKELHTRDNSLFEPYKSLSSLLQGSDYLAQGDFSERLATLIDHIANDYRATYGDEGNVGLTAPQVTALIHRDDLKPITTAITKYLKHKNILWLLFDNIDKGWATDGVSKEDVMIVRSLLDAARKLEHELQRYSVDVRTVLFLRNDVYDLLVKETADRGKEAYLLVDWTDPDQLREILKLRVLSKVFLDDEPFQTLWGRICVSHIDGEETSQYLIERCLMRPRFLLNLVNQCKSSAVNLNHKRIEVDDIRKGLIAYSTDLMTDIGFEIHDIDPNVGELLYAFIGSPEKFSASKLEEIFTNFGIQHDHVGRFKDLLLWYGFLGILRDEKQVYIYTANYNRQLLSGLISKLGDQVQYCINPAFLPALSLSSS